MFLGFRYITAAVRLLLLALLTLLTVIIALPILYISGKSRKVSYATAKAWGRSALFLTNVKVTVSGNKPKEKVLLMPNHQTFLDIFIVLAYYPSSIVAKKEIGDWPIIKFAIDLGRIILVDRKRMVGAVQAMRDIQAEVQSGGSVILFPEGVIYEGPLTKAFKPGSFKIAEETNTPIVPAAIKYLSRDMVWRSESFLANFFKCMGYWRTDVDFWFGEPVEGGTYEDLRIRTKTAIDQQLSTYLK